MLLSLVDALLLSPPWRKLCYCLSSWVDAWPLTPRLMDWSFAIVLCLIFHFPSVDALPPWLYLGPLLIFVDNHIHNVLGCFFSSRFVRLGGSSFLFVCFSTYPVVCHLLGAFVTWRYAGSRIYVIVILFRSSQWRETSLVKLNYLFDIQNFQLPYLTLSSTFIFYLVPPSILSVNSHER